MQEVQSSCYVLSRRALETVLELARTLLCCLHELLAQERALQERHAVSEPKVSGVI